MSAEPFNSTTTSMRPNLSFSTLCNKHTHTHLIGPSIHLFVPFIDSVQALIVTNWNIEALNIELNFVLQMFDLNIVYIRSWNGWMNMYYYITRSLRTFLTKRTATATATTTMVSLTSRDQHNWNKWWMVFVLTLPSIYSTVLTMFINVYQCLHLQYPSFVGNRINCCLK